MSMAWEITTDDVETVLKAHGVSLPEDRVSELHDGLDADSIEDGLLHYTDMDDQTASMLSDIEDHLLEEGVISGEKQFHNP